MPTILVIFGLRFYFYADEHLPIHVHLENGDGLAKIELEPEIKLVENKGIKPKDIKRAMSIVEQYKEEFIEKWEEIDEDIHISSFHDTEEPDYDNEIARIFRKFPQLNVSEVARSMGIHKSLLSKYIYGMKRPSEQRKEQIKESLHLLGQELMAV